VNLSGKFFGPNQKKGHYQSKSTGIFVKKLAKDTLNTAKKKQKKDRSRALKITFYKPIISIKFKNQIPTKN
jgi:hypothetical protein